MDWPILLIGLLIGLFSGTMSGAFGIGASSITIVLLRTLLGLPAGVAVATALPLSIPSAISGGATYCQSNMMKYKTAIACGGAGAVFSVLGAFATGYVPGELIMFLVAGAMFVSAYLSLEEMRKDKRGERHAKQNDGEKLGYSLLVGAIAGFSSGFLGIGGGILLVPLLSRLRGLPYRMAVPCSLVVMLIYIIPGSIAHFGLGNVDVPLLLAMVIGAVIGARFGAKAAMNFEADVKVWFVRIMVFFGVVLLSRELWMMFLS
ncbi:sulfite exporter TauE/SafE family protein [Candidatus Micrarchaeota archaeon]|nr:sulfite exporter TauE/SafE family protein [Candidatus Micrarchaeota archaeon]